jgi:hypothetical protein
MTADSNVLEARALPVARSSPIRLMANAGRIFATAFARGFAFLLMQNGRKKLNPFMRFIVAVFEANCRDCPHM